MTNAQIIFDNQMILLNAGKISHTGRTIKVMVNDEERNIPEPEPIHTFSVWKAMGFIVKKGEKAVARFPIWKYTAWKKGNETAEEAPPDDGTGHCFLKESCFFSLSQVERITEEAS